MTRYELTIETSDADALHAIIELFANVALAPSHEQSHLTDVTFDANDDALAAYCARFGFDADERTDVFTRVE
jgi:hypothetical protein